MAEIMTIVFSRLSAHPKTPLCKGKLAAHNPKASLVQREVARRSRDGGIVSTNYDLVLSRLPGRASLWSPIGVTESPKGDGLHGSPPGRSFCAYKRNQNTVKGDRASPLTIPLDA